MKPVPVWFMLLVAVYTTCSFAEYTIEGNHWSESDLPGDFFDNTIAEWKNMVRDHDVDDMIAKYTNDCIVIYNDKVLYGKLALREDYRAWFDETGVARIEVSLLDGGMLGEEHTFMINEHTLFDKYGAKIGSFTGFLVFSHVDGGFQTAIKVVLEKDNKDNCQCDS